MDRLRKSQLTKSDVKSTKTDVDAKRRERKHSSQGYDGGCFPVECAVHATKSDQSLDSVLELSTLPEAELVELLNKNMQKIEVPLAGGKKLEVWTQLKSAKKGKQKATEVPIEVGVGRLEHAIDPSLKLEVRYCFDSQETASSATGRHRRSSCRRRKESSASSTPLAAARKGSSDQVSRPLARPSRRSAHTLPSDERTEAGLNSRKSIAPHMTAPRHATKTYVNRKHGCSRGINDD